MNRAYLRDEHLGWRTADEPAQSGSSPAAEPPCVWFGDEAVAPVGRPPLTAALAERFSGTVLHNQAVAGYSLYQVLLRLRAMEPQNASVLLVFHPRMAERCLTGTGTFDPALEGLRAPRCFVYGQELHTLAPYAGWGSVLAWNCRRRPRSQAKARELALPPASSFLKASRGTVRPGGRFCIWPV